MEGTVLSPHQMASLCEKLQMGKASVLLRFAHTFLWVRNRACLHEAYAKHSLVLPVSKSKDSL